MRNVLAVFTLALVACLPAVAKGPTTGDMAPEFSLVDQNGKPHSISDYRGQWLVLYFYPKDDTPGCTTEACAFRDDIFKFRGMGVAVLGVSLDDVESHRAFAEKYSLPFPLLADTGMSAAGAYGVLRKFGPIRMASRQTFVIDPRGRIARHYEKVDPDVHSKQLQTDLASMMGNDKEAEQIHL